MNQIIKLLLPTAFLALSACMKNKTDAIDIRYSSLYGSEKKTLFDCTEPGIAGAGWFVAWTDQGLAEYYVGAYPGAEPTPPRPMRFEQQIFEIAMSSSLPGSEAGNRRLVLEKWSGDEYNLEIKADLNTKSISAHAVERHRNSQWDCKSVVRD